VILVREHTFKRPDGTVITIRTTVGEGVTKVELVEGQDQAQEPDLEPQE
jgi:hypothetical protein